METDGCQGGVKAHQRGRQVDHKAHDEDANKLTASLSPHEKTQAFRCGLVISHLFRKSRSSLFFTPYTGIWHLQLKYRQ